MSDGILDHDKIVQVLASKFGITNPHEYQVSLIKSLVQKHDVLAAMPTGWGKSSLYQVAGLLLPGITVVISPTIALMDDQVRKLNALNITAGSLHSQTSDEQRNAINESLDTRTLQFLYVSPKAFELTWSKVLSSDFKVGLIAVDEAHLIVDWGMYGMDEIYRTAYRSLRRRFPNVPVVATTGTATSETIGYIREALDLSADTVIGKGPADRSDIAFTVVRTDPAEDSYQEVTRRVMDLLKKHWYGVNGGPKYSGLVFTVTREDCRRLQRRFRDLGVTVPVYSSRERNDDPNVLEEITDQLQTGQIPFVIATSSLGQGLSISNLRWVVHDGMRPTIEDYWQQVGRVGRDGERFVRSCDAVLVGNPERDRERWNWRYDNIENQFVEGAERREMLAFGYYDWPGCRRGYLVGYLQDTAGPDCSGCDNCDTRYPGSIDPEEFDSSKDVVRAQLKRAGFDEDSFEEDWIVHPTNGIGIVIEKSERFWIGLFSFGKKPFLPGNGVEPLLAHSWRHKHGEVVFSSNLRTGMTVCVNREMDGLITSVQGLSVTINSGSGLSIQVPAKLCAVLSQASLDLPEQQESGQERQVKSQKIRSEVDWRNDY
jgi:RecQ family ATP-dependent DNA helicase